MIAKIGSFDFTDYVRAQPGDGLDPYGAPYVEPQFADNPFGAGQPVAHTAVGNRVQEWPLYLNDADTDALHALVIAFGRALGEDDLVLEWRATGRATSTFYTVAAARFEPDYSLHHGRYGWMAGVLRVWCNPPYGHTGTFREISPATAGGLNVMRLPVASIAGDAPAAVDVSFRVGYRGPGNGPVIAPGRHVAVGAVSHPSMAGVIPASQMIPGAGATFGFGLVIYNGDPFRAARERLEGNVQAALSPGTVYAGAGRMRVLALAETPIRSGMALRAYKDGAPIGATQLATGVFNRTIVDLGAFEVPSQDTRATHVIDCVIGFPIGTGVLNGLDDGIYTAAAGIEALLVLPEDRVAVIADRTGRPVGFDDTVSNGTDRGLSVIGRRDTYGNAWATSPLATLPLVVPTAAVPANQGYGATTTGSVVAAAALVHAPVRDMTAQAGILRDPNRHSRFALYKRTLAGLRVGADVEFPTASQMILRAVAANASITIAATAAINPFGQRVQELELRQVGNMIQANVYNGVGSVLQSVTATYAGANDQGTLDVLIAQATVGVGAGNIVTDVRVGEVPSIALVPSDTYRIRDKAAWRGHPVRGYSGDVALIGGQLQLDPSDAAVVVAIGGVQIGDQPSVNDVVIRAQERFQVAR